MKLKYILLGFAVFQVCKDVNVVPCENAVLNSTVSVRAPACVDVFYTHEELDRRERKADAELVKTFLETKMKGREQQGCRLTVEEVKASPHK